MHISSRSRWAAFVGAGGEVKPLKSHKPRGSNNAQGRVRWRAMFRAQYAAVRRTGDYHRLLKFLYLPAIDAPVYRDSALLRMIKK